MCVLNHAVLYCIYNEKTEGWRQFGIEEKKTEENCH